MTMPTPEEILAIQDASVAWYRTIQWRLGPDRSTDEIDALMAKLHPGSRTWGCRSIPGMTEEDVRARAGYGCACPGCLWNEIAWPDGISYSEYLAWQERETGRDPAPWAVESHSEPSPPALAERLAARKAKKLQD